MTTGASAGPLPPPQVLRESIRQEYWEVVERRVFTVTGNHPDEQTVDDLIETGRSEQIFKDAVQQQGRGQILDTVAEIQERHDVVRDLERKLLELQQEGLDALQKAKKLQKNSRMWICSAIIAFLGIVIVVIIVLVVIKPGKT